MNIIKSIGIEILAGIIVGVIISKAPKRYYKRMLIKFFGEAVLSTNFKIVIGQYHLLIKDDAPQWEARCEKRYYNGKSYKIRGPKKYTGILDISGVSQISQEIVKFRKEPITIVTDDIAYKHLDNSYISIGGPLSNELTYFILEDKSNKYLEFTMPDPIDNPVTFKPKINDNYIFQKIDSYDYGFILKIHNRRYERNNFFVCAGISGHGTSAAAWYLSKNWKKLYKKFGTNEFLLILKVSRGSDSTCEPYLIMYSDGKYEVIS